jgi:transketolase
MISIRFKGGGALMDIQALEQKARDVRRDILTMIFESGDGHPAPSLSSADILTALYFNVMNVDPANPSWPDRDRLVLSKGHACPALYAALAQRGFFPRSVYPTLRKLDSTLQGHPDMKKTPGVDMTTGSLGNGLGAGFGMAMAARLMGRSYRTYVIAGDGELGEGVVWEAAQAAPKYALGSLTLIVDNNGMQSGGPVEKVGGVINIPEKFRAFGWNVIEIDGHDMRQILDALTAVKDCPDRPTCVVAHTVKGKGVSFMEHNNAWHKGVPSPEQYRLALSELEG